MYDFQVTEHHKYKKTCDASRSGEKLWSYRRWCDNKKRDMAALIANRTARITDGSGNEIIYCLVPSPRVTLKACTHCKRVRPSVRSSVRLFERSFFSSISRCNFLYYFLSVSVVSLPLNIYLPLVLPHFIFLYTSPFLLSFPIRLHFPSFLIYFFLPLNILLFPPSYFRSFTIYFFMARMHEWVRTSSLSRLHGRTQTHHTL